MIIEIKEKFDKLDRKQKILLLAGSVSLLSLLALAARYRLSRKNAKEKKPTPKDTQEPENSKETPVFSPALSKALLEERAAALANVNYDLLLYLQKSSSYKGFIQITFDLNTIDSDLVIDYQGDALTSIIINGKDFSNAKKVWNGFSLSLPKASLQKTGNKVLLAFESKYSLHSKGGLRLLQEGKHSYVFADTFHHSANCIFPCFDQSSVRVKLNLLVLAPEGWNVIYSQQHRSVRNLEYKIPTQLSDHIKALSQNDATSKLWCYDTTHQISISSLRFAAGDYYAIKLEKDLDPKILATLYCRVNSEEIFSYYAKVYGIFAFLAVKYCEENFGHFPLRKIDHIFLPVSCENQGFIINDQSLRSHLSRQFLIQALRSIVSNTVYTYFGFFVGYEKWDQAWILKGIRELVTDLCINFIVNTLNTSENPTFVAVQKKFNIKIIDFELHFQSTRREAYLVDQLSNTYPLSLNVEDSEEFADYCKGPIYHYKSHAVMKQLSFILEAQNFKKILKIILAKYAWKALTAEDFLAIIDQTVDQNLSQIMAKSTERFIATVKFDISRFSILTWWEQWCLSDGINEIAVVWEADNNFFKNMLKISQTCYSKSKLNCLRYHRIKIGLFNNDAQLFKVKDVFIEGVENTPLIFEDETRIPSAVLTNYDSESYAKISLDRTSFEFFKANIDRIEDLEALGTIWRVFYKMVKEGLMVADLYLYLARVYLKQCARRNLILTEVLLKDSVQIIRQYVPLKKKRGALKSMFDILLNLFQENKEKFTWINVLIINYLPSFCVRKEDVIAIIECLKTPGFADPPHVDPKQEVEINWRLLILMQLLGGREEDQAALVSNIRQNAPADVNEYYGSTLEFLKQNQQLKTRLFEGVGEFVARESIRKIKAMSEGVYLSFVCQEQSSEIIKQTEKLLVKGLHRVFLRASLENLRYYLKFIGETLENVQEQAAMIKQVIEKYKGTEGYKTRINILVKSLEQIQLRAKVLSA